ncbi:MAG TPA: response regulator, partial [Pseudoxanthomonas sp.]|nr:response regulator [Pseudoxanthomonas sp.]
MGLQEHAAGRLSRENRSRLVQLPETIAWLPKLSSGFVREISRRLDSSAPAEEPVTWDGRESGMGDAPPVDTDGAFDFSGVEGDAIDASSPEAQYHDASAPADAVDEHEELGFDAAWASAPPDSSTADDGDLGFVLEPAHGSTPQAASAADGIWVSPEELELTRQAIVEQVMPLNQAWSDAVDAGTEHSPDDLVYHCGLVLKVMELIGTPRLAQAMELLHEGLACGDARVTPDFVTAWCGALLAALEAPGPDAAELLLVLAADLEVQDPRWGEELAAELARVRIGYDPLMVAARKRSADPADVTLDIADDVLPVVREGMLRELPGNAVRFGDSVRLLVATRSPEPLDEAKRIAHTLKGDANTVGLHGLGNLTHALEDIFIALSKQPELMDDACAELLGAASDCVEEIADHLLGRGPAPGGLLEIYQQVLDLANALTDELQGVQAATPGASAPADPLVPVDSVDLADPGTAQPAAVAPALPRLETGMAASGIQSLNVPSGLLDQMQRLAGETLVSARQIDQQLESLAGLHREQRSSLRNAQELIASLDDLVALRGAALKSTAQKSGAELDPLEIDQYNELHVISRQLLESHADSAEFMRRIERTTNALADLRSEQEQLNRELQRIIQRTRTVPFGQVSARLQRIVRQTAKQLMKPVQLQIVGEDVPVDAELLERVVEPLAHLLRNAVDHGIEAREQRAAAGKPETGSIVLRVGLQGDSAVIDIRDDGRGLDLDSIRARALQLGVLKEDQAVDERLLARLILLPGFSTRNTVDAVSGRGVGMDVVNQRIAGLRGTLTLGSVAGVGMHVQLRLPITQTSANVIIVRGQRQVTAAVAASVERVVSFASGECRPNAASTALQVALDDQLVPALPIESLYGKSADLSMWTEAGGIGLLLRDQEGRAHVVLVKGIEEVRAVVVKPLNAYLPPIPAVRGMTQLGDGGLAPVVDLDLLLASTLESNMERPSPVHIQPAAAMRVVVADDSLSVRRALEQLMQDAGFEVATARDGFEALDQINAKPTHALLVDLEMPRMNGLEVSRNLRNQPALRDLP